MTDQELLARRIAITQHIVNRCEDIGKTKIQKIVYFIQEAIDAPLHYPFRMHYYGPYSDELDGVLSLTKSLGYIDINHDPDGFGYHVTPVQEKREMSWRDYDISTDPDIKELTEVIDKAIDVLGELDTPQIELYATIHFIKKSPKGEVSKTDTLNTVMKLKPKFSRDEIDGSYNRLKKAHLI